MGNRYAMITRCDDKAQCLANLTHEIMEDYANQWGCDFIVMIKDGKYGDDYEMQHYRILAVSKYLETYERVLVIDSDIVIMPGTPNPFDVVPQDCIGTIYEDKGSREAMRQGVIMSIQERFGDVGWEEGYINTGFFVVSQCHKNIFQPIGPVNLMNNGLWDGFGYDDALIGYNIHKHNHRVFELPYQWNHMSMFSEAWNNSASRFDSWIIHYAGMACFPDDLSGRGIVTDNSLETRCKLIENDIDRITTGLMKFTDVEANQFQGVNSKVLTGKIGVQQKPIVIKIPNSPEIFLKELKVHQMGIPGTVNFLGVGEDDQLGKFMMLEKLMQIPYPISKEQLVMIAKKSLITFRQLYKAGVPWICKLEHIMIDEHGQTKLVDFNDEPWDRDIPFFNEEGGEAIIMDGSLCNEDGLYRDRYKYPWSGWKGCIGHLAEVNDLVVGEIWAIALNAMWTHEYQSLKNVHQPISIPEYSHIYRTETEENDKDFGRLVPPNRKCVDRESIILGNIPENVKEQDTWLDIGSNVGWFCHSFDPYFRTVGMEADKDMCVFAEMQGEYLGTDARFINKTLDWDVANEMIEYDVISALSVIHWSLINPPEGSSQTSVGEGKEYFLDLLKAICSKARKMFILEFPPYCYSKLGVRDDEEFMGLVQKTGKFTEVIKIGESDIGRPIIRCLK